MIKTLHKVHKVHKVCNPTNLTLKIQKTQNKKYLKLQALQKEEVSLERFIKKKLNKNPAKPFVLSQIRYAAEYH